MSLKKNLPLLLLLLIAVSCNDPSAEKKTADTSSEAKAEAADTAVSELSIYNLPSVWTTQDNEEIELVDLRGKVLVMVMIYTQCKAACPRLVADMRNLESQFSEEELEDLQLVYVSIDPEVDTPKRMKEFLKENEMQEDHWLFLRGSKEATQEFAAVLAVNYKRISPIDFTHSNIISVFNREGELVHQREGLGVDSKETIQAIKEEIGG